LSRYFLGVVPPEPLLTRIEEFRGRWDHPHHHVEPHVTLKIPFAWDQDAMAFLAPVRWACREAGPFDIRLGPTARFPEARVLYLAVEGSGIRALHLTVLGALAPFVPADPLSHEGEGYSPHLTLAVGRFGIDSAGLDAMEEAARFEIARLPAFTVESLRCYRRERPEDPWETFSDIPLGR
jgi:2'-5' RNA ligase